jgi:hypothetical protein
MLRREWPVARSVAKVNEISTRSESGNATAKKLSERLSAKCGKTGLRAKFVPSTLKLKPTIDASRISRTENFLPGLIIRGSAINAHG